MELGSAPRCGPRALPATSPSGPSSRCNWGLEPCTQGKPAHPLDGRSKGRRKGRKVFLPLFSQPLSSGPSAQLFAPPSPSSSSCR